LAFQPTLLDRRKNGTVIIPVHDGDPADGCLGRSGIAIGFCPWSGDPLRPIDRSDSLDDAGAPHACESMKSATNGEDLIVVYDPHRSKYLLPIFDGTPDLNCLGADGIEIDFCPWCGARLIEGEEEGKSLELHRARLPYGTHNPRF